MTENNKKRSSDSYRVGAEAVKAQLKMTDSVIKLTSNPMPNISQFAKSLPKITVPSLDNSIASAISSMIDRSVLSSLSKIELPSSLLSEISKQYEQAAKIFSKTFTGYLSKELADVTKIAKWFIQLNFPPNWTDENTLSVSIANLETMLLDEGLALAWVPPYPIANKMFNARSVSERRKILSNNRAGITKTCIAELSSIHDPSLEEYVKFALKSAESMQAGYWEPSQALSTNLIDTIMRQAFDEKSRAELTSHKNGKRADWKKYSIRQAVVFGGIWGAYSSYLSGNGDRIPRKYTRHASAHAVSNRQYTKINALIALMHATALLKLIEEEGND